LFCEGTKHPDGLLYLVKIRRAAGTPRQVVFDAPPRA
jgi:hypothetical protein